MTLQVYLLLPRAPLLNHYSNVCQVQRGYKYGAHYRNILRQILSMTGFILKCCKLNAELSRSAIFCEQGLIGGT